VLLFFRSRRAGKSILRVYGRIKCGQIWLLPFRVARVQVSQEYPRALTRHHRADSLAPFQVVSGLLMRRLVFLAAVDFHEPKARGVVYFLKEIKPNNAGFLAAVFRVVAGNRST